MRVSDLVSKINGVNTNELFISNEIFYKLKKSNLVPKENDVLVTSRGTLGLCYIIKSDDNFYFQDGMITWLSFKNHNEIISMFLDYLFRIILKSKIDRMSNGSTIKYISISNIKTLKIPVPPLALQEKFVSFVHQVEKSKQSVQKSLQKSETLYKALMQKYFDVQ